MDQAEQNLIQLQRNLLALGLRVGRAYEDEQRKLGLDQLLTSAQLSTEQGTLQSLDVLANLQRLTATHKEVFGRWMMAATEQLTKALAEISEDRREIYARDLTTALNLQLKIQMDFYLGRERWIEAAEEICRLIGACRENCSFEKGFGFQEPNDLERFRELKAVINEVHAAEVALFLERTKRVAASLALLDRLGSQ